MRTLGLGLVIVVGLALVGVRSASAGGEDTLTIGSLTMRVGEEGTVEVQAAGISQWRLGAWTFDVVHDPDVISTVACDGGEVGLCGPSFSVESDRVTGASKDGLKGAVTLAHFTFRCDREGTSPLSLDVSVWVDAIIGNPNDPELKAVEVQHGSVTCVAASPTTDSSPPTPAIALPPTGSGADGRDSTWPFAALAAFGAVAAVAGAALAWRRS
jgi:hypothetical protein